MVKRFVQKLINTPRADTFHRADVGVGSGSNAANQPVLDAYILSQRPDLANADVPLRADVWKENKLRQVPPQLIPSLSEDATQLLTDEERKAIQHITELKTRVSDQLAGQEQMKHYMILADTERLLGGLLAIRHELKGEDLISSHVLQQMDRGLLEYMDKRDLFVEEMMCVFEEDAAERMRTAERVRKFSRHVSNRLLEALAFKTYTSLTNLQQQRAFVFPSLHIEHDWAAYPNGTPLMETPVIDKGIDAKAVGKRARSELHMLLATAGHSAGQRLITGFGTLLQMTTLPNEIRGRHERDDHHVQIDFHLSTLDTVLTAIHEVEHVRYQYFIEPLIHAGLLTCSPRLNPRDRNTAEYRDARETFVRMTNMESEDDNLDFYSAVSRKMLNELLARFREMDLLSLAHVAEQKAARRASTAQQNAHVFHYYAAMLRAETDGLIKALEATTNIDPLFQEVIDRYQDFHLTT